MKLRFFFYIAYKNNVIGQKSELMVYGCFDLKPKTQLNLKRDLPTTEKVSKLFFIV